MFHTELTATRYVIVVLVKLLYLGKLADIPMDDKSQSDIDDALEISVDTLS